MCQYIDLPPEIRIMITDYLALPDLKSYATSCRSFSREALLRLWEKIHISPHLQGGEGIVAVVNTLLLDPIKASYVRQVRITTTYLGSGSPTTIFPHHTESADDPFWPRLTAALRLLVNLKAMTLFLLAPPSIKQEIPPQTQKMIKCLIDSHIKTVRFLRSSLPTQPLIELFQAWPGLRAVVIHEYRSPRDIVLPEILPNIRRIQAYPPWLEHLVPGRPIEQIFVPPTTLEHERSRPYVEKLNRVISHCPSLKHLRMHRVPILGETVLLSFSHSGITTLELVLCIHESIARDTASSLVTVALHGIIGGFPSLCALRVVYSHSKLPGSMKFPPPLDDASSHDAQFINRCRGAFDELVISTDHKALRSIRVEICPSTSRVSEGLWINAERTELLGWEVLAGVGDGRELPELAADDP
ncbi:hypothetical protein DL93DRAFT_2098381 [Clavulina sp. PMI_390]|nr:hypothetical protein DL93DRAFT_2098381 [Clavulina sp. PMI_390]